MEDSIISAIESSNFILIQTQEAQCETNNNLQSIYAYYAHELCEHSLTSVCNLMAITNEKYLSRAKCSIQTTHSDHINSNKIQEQRRNLGEEETKLNSIEQIHSLECSIVVYWLLLEEKKDLGWRIVIGVNCQDTYCMTLSLLKEIQRDECVANVFEDEDENYENVCETSLTIRNLFNGMIEYSEGVFSAPYGSIVSLLLVGLPTSMRIDMCRFKHASEREMIGLKKAVKRQRYNGYLMEHIVDKYREGMQKMNKEELKKIVVKGKEDTKKDDREKEREEEENIGQRRKVMLPMLFVTKELSMSEIEANEECFMKYLSSYEYSELTLEQIREELASIADKNKQIFAELEQIIGSTEKLEFVATLANNFEGKLEELFEHSILPQQCFTDPSYIREKEHEKRMKTVRKELHSKLLLFTPHITSSPSSSFPLCWINTEHNPSCNSSISPSSLLHFQPYLFIFAHGFHGHPRCLELLKWYIDKYIVNSYCYNLSSYKDHMDESIEEMGKLAAKEIMEVVQCYFNKFDRPITLKMVMIGHSLGGIILRRALDGLRFELGKISVVFWCYVSLASPHLGYLQGTKLLTEMGLQIFSRKKGGKCLDELAMKDWKNEEGLIRRLAKEGSLKRFRRVVLMSSVEDHFVPWHSARLERYGKDREEDIIEEKMINEIIGENNGRTIEWVDRVEVDFPIYEKEFYWSDCASWVFEHRFCENVCPCIVAQIYQLIDRRSLFSNHERKLKHIYKEFHKLFHKLFYKQFLIADKTKQIVQIDKPYHFINPTIIFMFVPYCRSREVLSVLAFPERYIGERTSKIESHYVCKFRNGRKALIIEPKNYFPSVLKLFNEVLTASLELGENRKSIKKMSVTLTSNLSQLIVEDNGIPIPIILHERSKKLLPEYVLTHSLETIYDDHQDQSCQHWRNGYGLMLAGIFSTKFILEIGDESTKQLLKLEWTNNMGELITKRVHDDADVTNYTRVSIFFDLDKILPIDITNNQLIDTLQLIRKRVIDMAGILNHNSVCTLSIDKSSYEEFTFSSWKQYVEMYGMKDVVYDVGADGSYWQVCVSKWSKGHKKSVGFVNGWCADEGTHVSGVMEQIVLRLMEELKGKNKKMRKVPFRFFIGRQVMLFVNVFVHRPRYESKLSLTVVLRTMPTRFGSTYEVTDKLQKMLKVHGYTKDIYEELNIRRDLKAKQHINENCKERYILHKYSEAFYAGQEGHICTLIITGEAYCHMAICGIDVLGRECYGVLPIKGELDNVRGMKLREVYDKYEYNSLIKVLGLEVDKIYTSVTELRYQSVILLMNRDNEGCRAVSQLFNFFAVFWPSLCQIDGFILLMILPLFRCEQDDTKLVEFYSMAEYKQWSRTASMDWNIKYYKNLASYGENAAVEFFHDLPMYVKNVEKLTADDENALQLAFDKGRLDERRKWAIEVQNMPFEMEIDYRKKKVSIGEYIRKEYAKCIYETHYLSVPSLIDGLKPTERRILSTVLQNNHDNHDNPNPSNNPITILQLSGQIMTHTNHNIAHKELCSTILHMCLKHIGSTNYNYLESEGYIGSRKVYDYEGKNYRNVGFVSVWTNPINRYLFVEEDLNVVGYRKVLTPHNYGRIEPEYFLPILPMVLVNGCRKSGKDHNEENTKTVLHPYKLGDVLRMMKKLLQENVLSKMNIDWQGWQGTVSSNNQHYIVHGKYEVDGDDVRILEVPVYQNLKEYCKLVLESRMRQADKTDEVELESVREMHVGEKVCFDITFVSGKRPELADIEKYLKLVEELPEENYMFLDGEGRLKQYESIGQMINEYRMVRLNGYTRRKEYLLSALYREKSIIGQKIRLIEAYLGSQENEGGTNTEVFLPKNMSKWESWFVEHKYLQYEELPVLCSTKLEVKVKDVCNRTGYNYLIGMKLGCYTKEYLELLSEELARIEEEERKLKRKTEQEMWLEELEELERVWNDRQMEEELEGEACRVKRVRNELWDAEEQEWKCFDVIRKRKCYNNVQGQGQDFSQGERSVELGKFHLDNYVVNSWSGEEGRLEEIFSDVKRGQNAIWCDEEVVEVRGCGRAAKRGPRKIVSKDSVSKDNVSNTASKLELSKSGLISDTKSNTNTKSKETNERKRSHSVALPISTEISIAESFLSLKKCLNDSEKSEEQHESEFYEEDEPLKDELSEIAHKEDKLITMLENRSESGHQSVNTESMVNVLTKYLKTPSKTVEKDDNKPKEINLEESGYELKIMNDKLKFDKKKKRRFTRRKVRKNCRNSRFRPIFISEPCVDLEEIELD